MTELIQQTANAKPKFLLFHHLLQKKHGLGMAGAVTFLLDVDGLIDMTAASKGLVTCIYKDSWQEMVGGVSRTKEQFLWIVNPVRNSASDMGEELLCPTMSQIRRHLQLPYDIVPLHAATDLYELGRPEIVAFYTNLGKPATPIATVITEHSKQPCVLLESVFGRFIADGCDVVHESVLQEAGSQYSYADFLYTDPTQAHQTTSLYNNQRDDRRAVLYHHLVNRLEYQLKHPFSLIQTVALEGLIKPAPTPLRRVTVTEATQEYQTTYDLVPYVYQYARQLAQAQSQHNKTVATDSPEYTLSVVNGLAVLQTAQIAAIYKRLAKDFKTANTRLPASQLFSMMAWAQRIVIDNQALNFTLTHPAIGVALAGLARCYLPYHTCVSSDISPAMLLMQPQSAELLVAPTHKQQTAELDALIQYEVLPFFKQQTPVICNDEHSLSSKAYTAIVHGIVHGKEGFGGSSVYMGNLYSIAMSTEKHLPVFFQEKAGQVDVYYETGVGSDLAIRDLSLLRAAHTIAPMYHDEHTQVDMGVILINQQFHNKRETDLYKFIKWLGYYYQEVNFVMLSNSVLLAKDVANTPMQATMITFYLPQNLATDEKKARLRLDELVLQSHVREIETFQAFKAYIKSLLQRLLSLQMFEKTNKQQESKASVSENADLNQPVPNAVIVQDVQDKEQSKAKDDTPTQKPVTATANATSATTDKPSPPAASTTTPADKPAAQPTQTAQDKSVSTEKAADETKPEDHSHMTDTDMGSMFGSDDDDDSSADCESATADDKGGVDTGGDTTTPKTQESSPAADDDLDELDNFANEDEDDANDEENAPPENIDDIPGNG
ncbi:hypothetical protein ACFBZI_11275 [Moraxella sp. ZJ142]|uniref:hypothetical protein n=1 Tax=Moraxella marmotae TaxID=3344520 RepID=UPI0035D4A562